MFLPVRDNAVHQKLASEIGVISWPELQRHFARGAVVVVSPAIELLEAARCIAEDNVSVVSGWMRTGQVIRATDDHARQWDASTPDLKAIVVAPWVLVQEIRRS